MLKLVRLERSPPPGEPDRPTDPLARLAEAAAQGDATSTRTLVVSLGPSLLRVVRGVLGAPHRDVEDVTQDAIVAVVRALKDFRRECTVLHFACRVALLTAMAARRRLRLREHSDLDGDEPAPEGVSPSAQALSARRRAILRSLLDQIPETQAEVLVMHVVVGHSVEEIAESLGVPFNTVRSRLRLAKEALRRRIAADPVLAESLEPEA